MHCFCWEMNSHSIKIYSKKKRNFLLICILYHRMNFHMCYNLILITRNPIKDIWTIWNSNWWIKTQIFFLIPSLKSCSIICPINSKVVNIIINIISQIRKISPNVLTCNILANFNIFLKKLIKFLIKLNGNFGKLK